MSAEEVRNVKKSGLMRYPLSFLEEASRALIGYKTWRDNKAYYKALPILDALIDYCTLDPVTRKRVYDLSEEERKVTTHHFVDLPKDLVTDFRKLYHGPREDGQLPIRYLSPGKSADPIKGVVTIRKPVNFCEAWRGYDPEYIVFRGGFFYKETKYQLVEGMGFLPYEEIVPMIDFDDPNLDVHLTDTIPFSYWVMMYDRGWSLISIVSTMIEKIIAQTLEGAGIDLSALMASSGSPNNQEVEADPLSLS